MLEGTIPKLRNFHSTSTEDGLQQFQLLLQNIQDLLRYVSQGVQEERIECSGRGMPLSFKFCLCANKDAFFHKCRSYFFVLYGIS